MADHELDNRQRFHMAAKERIVLGTLIAAGCGAMTGLARGSRLAGLAYLAENAHRMPRTKGTWYFFHKRKNYVVMKRGLDMAFLRGVKFGSAALIFLGTEALFDLWHTSLLSTGAAAAVTGLSLSGLNRLEFRQSVRSASKFTLAGLCVGAIEDALLYIR